MRRPDARKVQVGALGSSEGVAAGTLDETNGGYRADLWSGTPRATVDMLIGDLSATPLASLRDIERRLLLTKADAPLGDAVHAFQTARLRKLMAFGLMADAAIIAMNASVPNDTEYARVQADALLYAGNAAAVCGDATAARTTNADSFWIELRAYCLAQAGDTDSLELTQSVMSEQSLSDPVFDALFADIQNKTSDPPPDADKLTALHVFLLKQLKLPIAEKYGRDLGTPVDLLAFRDTSVPLDSRLDIAERLIQANAVSLSDLLALAGAAQFSPDELANPQAAAQKLSFFRGQALLRQAAGQAPDDASRAGIVAAAFRLGTQFGRLPLAAQLQADAGVRINPAPAMKAYVRDIGFALLLNGNAPAASRWAALLDKDDDVQLAARFNTLLNLFPITADQQKLAFKSLQWLADEADARNPEGGETTREIAGLVFGVYNALGEPIPTDVQKDYAEVKQRLSIGRSVDPEYLGSIEAARGNPTRKGEALAAIIEAVGPQGPADLSPDAIVRLVQALRDNAGAAAAKSFAIEALAMYVPEQPPPPPPAP
jgi:hypothetical protein